LEYLAITDLNISNKGNEPTYVVTGRQEVIDITLATSNIDLYFCKWRVSDKDSLSDHKYIEFRITTELQPIPPWRNPRATRWDAYIADLEGAMGGRIERIWTEEDIENEVAFIQESIDTSYKNNCKERIGIIQRRGHRGGTRNWIKCVKFVEAILKKYRENN